MRFNRLRSASRGRRANGRACLAMKSDVAEIDSDKMLSPHAQEVEFALILSRMIDAAKQDPAQMRLAIYEFARVRLKLDATWADEPERQRLSAALETAIQGVERFSTRHDDRERLQPPPSPSAKVCRFFGRTAVGLGRDDPFGSFGPSGHSLARRRRGAAGGGAGRSRAKAGSGVDSGPTLDRNVAVQRDRRRGVLQALDIVPAVGGRECASAACAGGRQAGSAGVDSGSAPAKSAGCGGQGRCCFVQRATLSVAERLWRVRRRQGCAE